MEMPALRGATVVVRRLAWWGRGGLQGLQR